MLEMMLKITKITFPIGCVLLLFGFICYIANKSVGKKYEDDNAKGCGYSACIVALGLMTVFIVPIAAVFIAWIIPI